MNLPRSSPLAVTIMALLARISTESLLSPLRDPVLLSPSTRVAHTHRQESTAQPARFR